MSALKQLKQTITIINAMNILFDFPEFFKINLGQYIESFIKWLIHNYDFFFDAIKQGVLWFLLQTRSVFMWFPWVAVIIIVFILAIGVFIFLVKTKRLRIPAALHKKYNNISTRMLRHKTSQNVLSRLKRKIK